MVFNPRGFLTQSSLVKFNRIIPQTNFFEYEEEVSSEGFKWNFVNTYQVDPETNLVVESEQFIHPKYGVWGCISILSIID